jgi:hypothetical protein
LGNRIEELINLECYCINNDISCNYYWNNIYKFRTYNNLLKCKNVVINNLNNNINFDNNLFGLSFGKHNHNEMIAASKNITYNKDISTNVTYISIHIRSTDKLNNRGKYEFTYDLFINNLNKTIDYLNENSENNNIFIATDDNKYKDYFIKNLNKNYNFVDPFLNLIDDPIYKDFFSLVNSKKIIMVPKFSSFAATASLLGNNILVSHCNEHETSLHRYKCNIEYI